MISTPGRQRLMFANQQGNAAPINNLLLTTNRLSVASPRRRPATIPFRCAFTLIEMMTTVAVLIIVLGLMVSLARYVRDKSAQELTRTLLRQLDGLLLQYQDHNRGAVPMVERLLPPNPTADVTEDATFARSARINNEQITRALRSDYRAHQTDPSALADPFEQLPISVYDKGTLRDAWGSPIVFMPGQHRLIGLAPSRAGQDQAFFFSAGPDKRYLTRDDNVYSYETVTKQ